MTKQFRRRRANMRPLLIYLLIVETRVHCMAVCRMEKQRWKKMQQQQRSKGMKNSYRIKYQSTVYHPIVYRFISLSRFEKLVWLFVFVLLSFLPSLTWTSLVLVAYKSFSLFSALFSPERAIKFNLFNVCVSFIFEEFGRFVVHHSQRMETHFTTKQYHHNFVFKYLTWFACSAEMWSQLKSVFKHTRVSRCNRS